MDDDSILCTDLDVGLAEMRSDGSNWVVIWFTDNPVASVVPSDLKDVNQNSLYERRISREMSLTTLLIIPEFDRCGKTHLPLF